MRNSARQSRIRKWTVVGFALAGLAVPAAATAYPVDPDPSGAPAWKNRVVFVYNTAAVQHRVAVVQSLQRFCHKKAGSASCLMAP